MRAVCTAERRTMMNKIKILVGSRSRTAAGRVHRIIQHITGCTHKQEVAARTWSNEYTLELQLGSGLADEAAAGRRERRNDELVTYVWLQRRGHWRASIRWENSLLSTARSPCANSFTLPRDESYPSLRKKSEIGKVLYFFGQYRNEIG